MTPKIILPRATLPTAILLLPVDEHSLSGELDEAATALTCFDVARLEAIEVNIRTLTAAHLASGRERLPELLDKHALLGQLLAMTAANLKVLGSVLSLSSLDTSFVARPDTTMEMI